MSCLCEHKQIKLSKMLVLTSMRDRSLIMSLKKQELMDKKRKITNHSLLERKIEKLEDRLVLCSVYYKL